jgi:hypothetical protein
MHHLWATSGSAEIAPAALALTKKRQRVSPQKERAEFAALLPKKADWQGWPPPRFAPTDTTRRDNCVELLGPKGVARMDERERTARARRTAYTRTPIRA